MTDWKSTLDEVCVGIERLAVVNSGKSDVDTF